MDVKQQALVAASIAGLLALAGAASAQHPEGAAAGGDAACYGINKCKGTGECGGKGHSCHGANACKGQGYLKLNKETCLKIEGGRLTESAESAS